MKTQMRSKKILSLCLSLVLILALLPVGASAANYVGSGDCGLYGGNLRWSLSSDGFLYIQGDGPMADYSDTYRAPWDNLRSTVLNVQFSEGVTSIGASAFRDCDNLMYVSMPYGITGIGSYAFAGCTLLPDISIPDSVSSIGSYAFKDCIRLSSLSIPSRVSVISEGMFSGCYQLGYVGIPGAVVIGSEAFKGCTGLSYQMLPSTLTAIGNGAFRGCTNLTSIDFPAGLKELGDYAFSGCNKLVSLTLPAGLTTIGEYAFSACTALTSVTIPNGVTAIGSYAFYGCIRLASLTLPGTLRNLGSYAFSDCTGLSAAVVSEGVTFISESAFNGCVSLLKLDLPKSLVLVAVNAFANCPNIAAVNYGGTRAEWEAISIASGNAALTYGGIHADDDPELPKVPAMLEAKATPGKVTVTWTAAADAQKYQILRRTGNGAWQRVSESKKLIFEDFTAVGGVTYSYTVQAYTLYGWGDYDPVGVQATAVAVVPLSVISVTPDKTGAGVGDTITWTAAAQGNQGTIEYNFWLYQNGSNIKTGAYTTANTFSYTPTAIGTYSVKVYIRYQGSTDGMLQSKEGGSVLVTAASPAGPLSLTGVTPDKTTASIGDTVTWTAAATGGSGTLQFCFYIYKDGAVVQKGGYGAAKTVSYKITEAGTYTAKVFVKDGSGAAANKMSAGVAVNAPAAPLAVTGITPNKTAALVGDTVTWTAAATGGSGTLRYCFYVYRDGTVVQKSGYGTAKTFSYKITEAGSYSVKVFVKDGSGASGTKQSAVTAAGTGEPLSVTGVTADKTTALVGDTVTWTAAAKGGSGTLRYCFYVCRNGAVVQKSGYGTAKTFSYKITEAGSYSVKVFVKDASGKAVTKLSGVTAAGTGAALAIARVAADKTSAGAGDTVTWTVTASGGYGQLKYCYYVYKDGTNIKKSGYGTAATFSCKVTEAGTYTVKVFVKDAVGTAVTQMSGKLTVTAMAR